MNRRLPRQARVRVRAEFNRVFGDGRRTGTPILALHLLHDGQPARLGLAVSRKVDRRAVGRNRIKRALREEFRALRARLPDAAFVIVARPAAAGATRTVLREAFHDALRRAGALPAPESGGTMPAAPLPIPAATSAIPAPAADLPDPTPRPAGE
ncbi:ribonuclease P protein component [Luteimonas sp. MJ250]|uniref:ribonuclease P protein component n=1 Tax=Luteimonas sp. MJ250 TaxID=3129236 RepID=UPI0031BB0FD7